MDLESLIRLNRTIRAIGFDDAPFDRDRDTAVPLAGIVCAGTRFEGMVWGKIHRDGLDATEVICQLLIGGKFLPQLHLLLLDGIAFGGFNLVNLPDLARRLHIPCVTVMRRMPNLVAVERAICQLPESEYRLELLRQAGPIHETPPFYFQVCGEQPEIVGLALKRLTDTGKIPEALRLAHLIGAAVVTGVSSSSA